MKNTHKKIALVLSGGGFNGAFQLGAINYINENWKKITGLNTPMRFDLIAGVSTGALNGALIAMNKLELLNNLWINKIGKNGVSEIYTSDIIDTSSKSSKIKLKIDLKSISKRLIPEIDLQMGLFKKLGIVFSKNRRKKIINDLLTKIERGIKFNFSNFQAVADNTPLKRKLEKFVSQGEIIGTKFYCGFVSLDTGKYHSVHSDSFLSNEDFINGILASTSIPVIWKPIPQINFKTNGGIVSSTNNVDGGIRNVSPLGDVIKLINDEQAEYKIIVINCNSGTVKQEDFGRKSIGEIASRSVYDITLTEIFNNDVNQFIQINELVKQTKQICDNAILTNKYAKELKTFEAVVINPHKDIELGSALVANEELINNRINHGKAMAKIAFGKKDVNNG
jgi:NTE family protein